MKVSVVTPIHNESSNIPELVERIEKTMSAWTALEAGRDWEHVACDDHSSDGSFELLQRLTAAQPHLKPVKNPQRSGQTGGFETGFRHATGDVIVTMDADLQNLPEDIPVLLKPIEEGRLDLVNAIRARRQHAGTLIAISKLGNVLIRRLMVCPVSDAASNFTALKANFAKDLKLVENDHRYLIPILVHRGMDPKRIGETNTRHEARKHGASKYSALRKALTGFPELLRCKKRLRRGFYDWPKESQPAAAAQKS
ncbi:MAG TPA: glycosyltransferase family 2 protein [Planctomycetota bacterium]|nr:glycosyltransferase family 2 protein [Planctomycetota bacterium]